MGFKFLRIFELLLLCRVPISHEAQYGIILTVIEYQKGIPGDLKILQSIFNCDDVTLRLRVATILSSLVWLVDKPALFKNFEKWCQ